MTLTLTNQENGAESWYTITETAKRHKLNENQIKSLMKEGGYFEQKQGKTDKNRKTILLKRTDKQINFALRDGKRVISKTSAYPPNTLNKEKYLSVNEAANILKKDRKTIYAMLKAGQIKGVKDTGMKHWKISTEELPVPASPKQIEKVSKAKPKRKYAFKAKPIEASVREVSKPEPLKKHLTRTNDSSMLKLISISREMLNLLEEEVTSRVENSNQESSS